jgi:predicted nucleotidyltransferase
MGATGKMKKKAKEFLKELAELLEKYNAVLSNDHDYCVISEEPTSIVEFYLDDEYIDDIFGEITADEIKSMIG